MALNKATHLQQVQRSISPWSIWELIRTNLAELLARLQNPQYTSQRMELWPSMTNMAPYLSSMSSILSRKTSKKD